MNIVSRQWIRIYKNGITNQNYFCNLGKAFTYKSAYSLDKLYPTCNLKLYTPTFVPEDSNVKFNGYIPLKEIDITYSRSSGAGGQHVNCTSSKVDIRFHLKNAKWLSEEIKEKLFELHKNKLTKEGYLIIKSEITRSQQLNLAHALEKLRTMIRDAIKPPPETSPETKEKIRKGLLKAARQRLFEKRKRSQHNEMKRPDIDF